MQTGSGRIPGGHGDIFKSIWIPDHHVEEVVDNQIDAIGMLLLTVD